MKKMYVLIVIAVLNLNAFGQVPRKIVVEHFTNSNCGICASRNPSFYTNLNNQVPKPIHLAVHPSSPYSNCLLYQQNTTANDARTNYYGIYGGTPRLVINGTVIPSSANYSNASLFTPYQAQTSPVSIRIVQQKFNTDSIKSTIIIKTVAANTLGNLSLFVSLAEDTVFYTGGNGETTHFDVFRKALTSTSGLSLTLPSSIGDSLIYSFTSLPNAVWNFSRIYTVAILQQTTNKSLVQAEAAPASSTVVSGISNVPAFSKISVFPNPFSSEMSIDFGRKQSNTSIKITDIVGKTVLSLQNISESKVQIEKGDMKSGIYFLTIKDENNTQYNQTIVIE
jgi:Secretion system C-terminal sorting domain